MLKQVAFGIVVLLLADSGTAEAQQMMFDHLSPNDGIIYLRSVNGNEIPFDAQGNAIEPNAVFRMSMQQREEEALTTTITATGQATNGRSTGSGPVFHLTYLDQINHTGMGFDDPTTGAARRNALEAAIHYYASVIQDPGEADIEIRESFSGSPSSNPFAFSAAYYFGSKGFNSPFTQYHLVSGTDPYSGFPDGYMQFNFNDALDYSYNVVEGPNGQVYDFYTIALHEIMHLLGFTSYATATGESAASPDVYTSFDQLLADYTKNTLFGMTGTGSESAISVPSPSNLTNDQVWFQLYPGQFAPVYSPSPFNGSSLDHFDNDRSAHGGYVMHPSLDKGVSFKLLQTDEVRVLEELGYDVNYSVATSINENAGSNGPVKVLSGLYPNPASVAEAVRVDIGQINEPEILVIVYDMLGRQSYSKVILNKGPGPVTAIDPHNQLTPGMYIVIGSTRDELFNGKLVIR